MGIIQLYGALIREIFPPIILLEESPDDIAKRSLYEEVLLFQSEFLAKICVVVGVEDVCDAFGFTSFLDCFDVVGVVEF